MSSDEQCLVTYYVELGTHLHLTLPWEQAALQRVNRQMCKCILTKQSIRTGRTVWESLSRLQLWVALPIIQCSSSHLPPITPPGPWANHLLIPLPDPQSSLLGRTSVLSLQYQPVSPSVSQSQSLYYPPGTEQQNPSLHMCLQWGSTVTRNTHRGAFLYFLLS